MKYIVYTAELFSAKVIVEANSVEEAIDKSKKFGDDDIEWQCYLPNEWWEVEKLEELEEEELEELEEEDIS